MCQHHGKFVHLHLHSMYSTLDGMIRPEQIVAWSLKHGVPYAAITDHGNLHGAIDLYQQASQAGLQPIIGCELYLAPGLMEERVKGGDGEAYYHLLAFAADERGFANLRRLSSLAHLRGFYYKPRIDRGALLAHAEGLILTSGCLASSVAAAWRSGGPEAADAEVEWYARHFDGRFYLEVQHHSLPEQAAYNQYVRDAARRFGLPLVGTSDAHYACHADARVHDVLLAIGTCRYLDEEDRFRFGSDEFWLMPPDEMVRRVGEEAAAGTLDLAGQVKLEIPLGRLNMPRYPVPEGFADEMGLLEQLSWDGLARRCRVGRAEEIPAAYAERLRYELGVIAKMGFAGYFLIVQDYINWAKSQGIRVGPGRGSAAGSLMAYAIGITDLDPIRHGLLFERFLNPERVSMPDIDTDFQDDRRDEVFAYLRRRWGEDSVVGIATFGTLQSKAALKDVARTLRVPFTLANQWSGLIPKEGARALGLREARASKDVRDLLAKDETFAQAYDLAEGIEGLVRQVGVHAAGVVIAPGRAEDFVPLWRAKDGRAVAQWDYAGCEAMGLVKMDVLGLTTLGVIADACRIAGVEDVPGDGELDDPKVYEAIRSGDTVAVFQYEGEGMRKTLMDMQASCFEDLVAAAALYRPGPMGHIPAYCRRKLGQEAVSFAEFPTIGEAIRPALEPTYGIPVYQEQVMEIARIVCGYSLGQADLLRRAIGKKDHEKLAKEKDKFIAAATARGFPAHEVEALWRWIEPFADYGFNKSHAASYALLAYQTSWLKVYHPLAFWSAVLNSAAAESEKLGKYTAEVRRRGIEVYPPSVNGAARCEPYRGGVRLGLNCVKGVGAEVAEAIARGGPYAGLDDLLARHKIDVGTAQSLAKAGAMADFGLPVRELLSRAEYLRSREGKRTLGMPALFDLSASSPPDDPGDLARWEWEGLGFALQHHPTRHHPHLAALARGDAAVSEPGRHRVPVVVVDFRRKVSRRGTPYMIATLESEGARFEAFAFREAAEAITHKGQVGLAEVLAEGAGEEGELKRVVQAWTTPEEALEELPLRVELLPGCSLFDLIGLAQRHPGRTPLYHKDEALLLAVNRRRFLEAAAGKAVLV